MAQYFLTDTERALVGNNGSTLSKGQARFYDNETGDFAPVFGDAGLLVPLAQPIIASESGIIPRVYLSASINYKAIISDSSGNITREIYPVARTKESITVLNSIDELKGYKGSEKFVMMWDARGCPMYYKRLTACEGLPKENLPKVIQIDCNNVWVQSDCSGKLEICSAETLQVSCNSYVLVQECGRIFNEPSNPIANHAEFENELVVDVKNPTARMDGNCNCLELDQAVDAKSSLTNTNDDCGCAGGNPEIESNRRLAPPIVDGKVGKANVYDLVNAAINCSPLTCIRSDSPELALQDGKLVRGERLPEDLKSSAGNGYYSTCLKVIPITHANNVCNHVQLDTIGHGGALGKSFPEISISNPSRCARRYEIRALNRIHRIKEPDIFGSAPTLSPDVPATFQTRMGLAGDALLDSTLAPQDHNNSINWLETLSISDSFMYRNKTGIIWADPSIYSWIGNVSYTENSLFVNIASGSTTTIAVKFHLYWDTSWLPNQIPNERIHYSSRIIAVRIH